MPEIKNTFVQGKMNKDLDERLLPNGQYRDARNIEVSTSEDSDVGVVKNIIGNRRVENIIDTDTMTCVGSIADEKTNKIYWFVSSYEKDAIIENDVELDITTPVLVDMHAGTSKAVLKFSGNIITGINIIDNLLFWTDNNSEPKKINIDECKKGTVDMDTHTQLSFKNGSASGVTIDKVAVDAADNNLLDSTTEFGKYFWYAPIPFVKAMGNIDINGADVTDANFDYDYSINPGYVFSARHYRGNKFLGIKEIRYFGNTSEEAAAHVNFSGDNNGTTGRLDVNAGDKDWKKGDVLFGNDIKVDIEERHITVIKPKPLTMLSVKINHEESATSSSTIPNLFETKFPRFSYRYKYRDGEYSVFAPFTQPVFNAKYPKDTSSSDVNIFYNKDNAYDIKDPYNKAMVNSIHSVELSSFIDAQTPEDVVEIDILYKQEESSVIYSIDTIKHIDKEWHTATDAQGANIGYNNDFGGNNYSTKGGLTKGKYIVTTENIYAALPSNQLLRPWDNVPKKALAQEITGNRVVYGNYVQNYDLIDNAEISVGYGDRMNNIGSFSAKGLPSVKSQRNYQLGVVYCDEYGRETPVFTSNEAAINIPWQDSSGNKNASKSNQLKANIVNNFPEWVDSFKFFIKETSNPYYNLTMERAWVTKSTYELDNSEGHVWISFPSSDRNKISEEDYIILKKKIGVGEGQVSFENKYKIIDIKNEAPDAIKYQLVNQGTMSNQNDSFTKHNIPNNGDIAVFNVHTTEWPSYYDPTTNAGTNVLRVGYEQWLGNALNTPLHSADEVGGLTASNPLKVKDLYISWWRGEGIGYPNSEYSRKYKIVGGKLGGTHYVLNLEKHIAREDADIAHAFGDSTQQTQPTSGPHASGGAKDKDPATQMHEDLYFQIEKRELKESEDFSGKFFVKISKNQTTDLITDNNPVDITKMFHVKSNAPTWYWEDKINDNISPSNNDYGLNNYGGIDSGIGTGTNNIRNDYQNNNNAGDLTDGDGHHSLLLLTDYHTPWQGIHDRFGPTFFVDSMFMAAGQSEASDLAKYCCVTWSGCTKDDGNLTPEDSAWSYPPLKTWIGDVNDTTGLSGSLDEDSVWYEDNLISTSVTLPDNADYNNFKIDGWVGPLQGVYRSEGAQGLGANSANSVNGLEGWVTTTETHSVGPRRWFSGITGSKTQNSAGVDTNTYSFNGETGRHFMHLSFFAPGKDLHSGFSGNTDIPANVNGSALYGEDGWMNYLQGIWGGGVFTGENKGQKFGTSNDHVHLAMEGNYDGGKNVLLEPAGPGVGYGYNENYREIHERQWDPTFNVNGDEANKIRNFIRNLHAGAKFRWTKKNPPGSTTGSLIDNTIYTIKSVTIKKLYNHTSWRKTYNRWTSGEGYNVGGVSLITGNPETPKSFPYQSVEETALTWLNQLDGTGVGQNANNEAGDFKDKIVQFGKAHNRRLCYIIELDKNPENSQSAVLGNLVSSPSYNFINANHQHDKFLDIEFLDPVLAPVLDDLSKFPAVWEVDPKKQEVDLDIYYEASDNIPTKLNKNTSELFAPIGCRVEVLNSNVVSSSHLEYWDGKTAIFKPGFARGSGGVEIDYTGMSFKFIRQDGSYTVAQASQQSLIGDTAGYKTEFTFEENVGDVITAGLSWFNCFSFGNGLESNRIKDDFNEPFISNGVKASTTTQEAYKEERRKSGLIYSGIYNSNSGVNNLNEFIMAEKITKDLNPTYGSIQKLFSRNTDLITFCEDKVLKVLANKDAVFNADGNTQLTASENVLGQTIPFVGDYGISKNPESFASESYRAYFTDKQRGAVLRLSRDGLTPISDAGMKSWFRDNLKDYNSLIGTYDSYKEDYNLTLTNNDSFFENIINDTFVEIGEELGEISVGTENIIRNPGVMDGNNLQYLYEQYDVAQYDNPNNPFDWSIFTQDDYDLTANVTITRHTAIVGNDANGGGGLQPYVPEGTSDPIPAIPYEFGEFKHWDDLPDDGWFYDPWFDGTFGTITSDIFGSSAFANRTVSGAMHYDNQAYSYVHRHIDGVDVDESNPAAHPTLANWVANVSNWTNNNYNPSVDKPIEFPQSGDTAAIMDKSSQFITKNDGSLNGVGGAIVFDRVIDPLSSWVEFRDIGRKGYGLDGTLMDEYASDPSTPNSIRHRTFYNGDEIHVQLKLKCYTTNGPYGGDLRGYNYIMPTIKLMDGTNAVPDQDIRNVGYGSTRQYNNTGGNVPYDPYNYAQGLTIGAQSIHTDMPLVDGFGDQSSVLGPTGYENINGVYYHKRLNSNNFAHGNTVVFTRTDDIAEIASYDNNNPVESVTVVVGFSVKFQDKTGNYSGLANNHGVVNSGSIVDAKVVDDFRIRVYNSEPRSTSSTYGSGGNDDNSAGDHPMKGQLWEIKSMQIKKGFGLTGPYTAYVQGTNAQITTAEVQAVPPIAIPEWTEISHAANYGFGNNSWFIDEDAYNNPNSPNNHAKPQGFGPTLYGRNYSATPQTGLVQNDDISLPPSDTIHYVVPNGFNMNTGAENPPAAVISPNLSIPNAANYNRVTAYTNNGDLTGNYNANKINVQYDNSWIWVKAAGPNDGSDIKFDLGNGTDMWETGMWYLVDVEFDENYGAGADFGNGGGNGTAHIVGVADSSGMPGSSGTEIDPEGIGLYAGNLTKAHVWLQQHYRTEYTPQAVLRGIFQVHPNSWVMDAGHPIRKETFVLRIYGCTNEVKINKIITKKLSGNATWDNWLAESGYANDWTFEQQALNVDEVMHAFDKKKVYYRGNALNWDVPALSGPESIDNNDSYKWDQLLDQPPSHTDPTAWQLRFNVKQIDNSTPIAGKLRGFIGIDDGNNVGQPQGVYFTDIIETGRYNIRFTFDANDAALDENGDAVWRVQRADLGSNDYIDYPNITPINLWPGNFPHMINKIWFCRADDAVDNRFSVSDISLTNSVAVFTGGSSTTWNFANFTPDINDYIFWDSGNLNIQLNDCPVFENGQQSFININQLIDHPIQRYQQYKVRITHDIDWSNSSAGLMIYYYNNEGFGFQIDVQNYLGTQLSPIEEEYDVIIGDPAVISQHAYDLEWNPNTTPPYPNCIWSATNPDNPSFNARLKNSFVIQIVGGEGDIIRGSIDNISMVQTISINDNIEDTTVTFNEGVKGWTSFKDFILENGASVSKNYFTLSDGALYKHYTPQYKDHNGDWVWTENAKNYNRFYGEFYESSVQVVLNQEPSLVKTFNTLNYEGTQAYIIEPEVGEININNAEAIYSGGDIHGWECSEIKTDLDQGSIKEFIKKEGKWFNYIKGLSTDDSLDTTLFSVQGIGVIQGVEDIIPPPGDNDDNGDGDGDNY